MKIKTMNIHLRDMNATLRNMLTGILGNAQLLSEEHLTVEQQAMVNDILTCANALKNLANDMVSAKQKAPACSSPFKLSIINHQKKAV